ncbi:MAG: enoyl-CoA hydratase [Planctomycetota bacterium]|nr:MAG: enoyl-CoA hydratase [Planctomycetota bacterium]
MSAIVHYTLTEDGLALLRMDDGKVNAINEALLEGLERALARAEAEQARALVLQGRPGCFSAGLDLKRLPQLQPGPLHEVLGRFARLLGTLLASPRPVVMLSTGHALAGGAVLLLCADRRLGVDLDYQYGLREVPMGIPMPEAVLELARLWIPPPLWMEAIIHGATYLTPQAVRAGLLDAVVPPEEAEAAAHQAARELAALPNPAYVESKRRLRAPALQALGRGVPVDLSRARRL